MSETGHLRAFPTGGARSALPLVADGGVRTSHVGEGPVTFMDRSNPANESCRPSTFRPPVSVARLRYFGMASPARIFWVIGRHSLISIILVRFAIRSGSIRPASKTIGRRHWIRQIDVMEEAGQWPSEIQLASALGSFRELGPAFEFFLGRGTVTFIVPDFNERVTKASFNAARDACRDARRL